MSDKPFDKEIMVDLDREEIEQLSTAMAEATMAYKDAEAQKKLALKNLNAEIATHKAEAERLAAEVQARRGLRMVSARYVNDPINLKVAVVRVDRPEPVVLEMREMTTAEVRQLREDQKRKTDQRLAPDVQAALDAFARQMAEGDVEKEVEKELAAPSAGEPVLLAEADFPGLSKKVVEELAKLGITDVAGLREFGQENLGKLRKVGKRAAGEIFDFLWENPTYGPAPEKAIEVAAPEPVAGEFGPPPDDETPSTFDPLNPLH